MKKIKQIYSKNYLEINIITFSIIFSFILFYFFPINDYLYKLNFNDESCFIFFPNDMKVGFLILLLSYFFSFVAIGELKRKFDFYKNQIKEEANLKNIKFISEVKEMMVELGFEVIVPNNKEINPNEVILTLKKFLRQKLSKPSNLNLTNNLN